MVDSLNYEMFSKVQDSLIARLSFKAQTIIDLINCGKLKQSFYYITVPLNEPGDSLTDFLIKETLSKFSNITIQKIKYIGLNNMFAEIKIQAK